MRNLSIGLSTTLLVASLFGTGCTSKPAEKSADANPVIAPHRTDVYFLVNRPHGLVAYVPEGSVTVVVKIDPNLTKPYVEIPKMARKSDSMGLSGKEFIYIAWRFGGTLYVKDVQQVRDLLIVQ